ncbi:MAG: tandem-95 repeat protein, partial [Methylomonas sp.]|nr:tandem-95 repeat protein [Methylomonas sp.]
MPKSTQLNISYTVKKPVGYVQAGTKQLTVRITAKDYDKGQAQFVGDRNLENPGYSDFTGQTATLKFNGAVTGAAGDDRLDAAWIEQRLKYLGYAQLDDNGKPTANGEIVVDGRFTQAEREALKQFEAIVRQGSAIGSGSDDGEFLVCVQYKATLQQDGRVAFEEVPGSLQVANNTLTEAELAQAIAQAVEQAKQSALAQLGNLNDSGNNGVDGLIEAGGSDPVLQTQRNTTLSWLNAYNSPHWMQFFAGTGSNYAQTNNSLPGWINRKSVVVAGKVQSTWQTSNNVFGTSWLFDLMLATSLNNQATPEAQRRNELWYSGTNKLGTELDLGINTDYISANYQNGIYGDEFLLGLSDLYSVDLKNITASNAASATPQQKLKYLLEQKALLESNPATAGQWDYQKAQQLADLLQYINRVVPTSGQNNQTEALKDFLAVYNATQINGGWNNLNITNGSAEDQATIRAALFGDGTQMGGVIDENNMLLGANGLGTQLTQQSLAGIMGKPNGFKLGNVTVDYGQWAAALNPVLAQGDINTAQRLSMFLANASQETYRLATTSEVAALKKLGNLNLAYEKQYFNQTYNGKLLNTEPDDGYNFRGQGLLHLTGRTNYAMATFGTSYQKDGTFSERTPKNLNAYLGTDDTSVAFTQTTDSAGIVTLQGTTQPGYWVRVVFATQVKMNNKVVHDVLDIQADSLGNFTAVSSGKISGNPSVVSVKYNFLEQPDLLQQPEFAAPLGVWYWRYIKSSQFGDNNTNADRGWSPNDFRNTVKKINFTEQTNPTNNTNYQDRLAKFTTAQGYLERGNAYGNMQYMLQSLGFITATQIDNSGNSFGIRLGQRTAISIDSAHKLVAEQVAAMGINIDSANSLDIASNDLTNTPYVTQTLIQQISANFAIPQDEELNMLLIDLLDQPVQLIAQATTASESSNQGEAKQLGTFGYCLLVDDRNGNGFNIYDFFDSLVPKPIEESLSDPGIGEKIELQELREKNGWMTYYEWSQSFTVKDVLRLPQHGNPKYGTSVVSYIADQGYRGNDRMDILVEGKDFQGSPVSARVNIYIKAVSPDERIGLRSYYQKVAPSFCPSSSPTGIWKISNQPSKLEIGSVLPDTLSFDFVFTDITGSTLAQTTGEGLNVQITFDTDAAGYGWFVDSTPSLTEEFLPTSNPYEWVAKAGSEAEGKMDLLSVWLHELGHALGMGHSAEGGDFMAATLSPGVRLLPTAEELAWLTGWGLDPLAGADQSAVTSWPALPLTPDAPAPGPWPLDVSLAAFIAARGRRNDRAMQDSVAHPTLTNGGFDPAQAEAWATQGQVDMADGAATLKETAASQTRLSQAFVVGPNDRFLSFTLSGIALDDVDNAPDDAFEVALLDANSGLSLLGGTGLSRNDALLNLQADGQLHAASQVATIENTDGSLGVLVDLSGIAAGTVVNLSFDLLGFGKGATAESSQITVNRLHLGQPLIANADAASTLEDQAVDIAVLDNDQSLGAAAPVLVQGPAHGRIEVLDSGLLRYVPDANWFGEDSFSYRLTQDRQQSGPAQVTVTVTPVNDAPTIASRSVDLDKDGSIVVDLLHGAEDVDGDALSVVITEPPANGSLTQNVDGTWTYVSKADRNGNDVVRYRVTDGQAGVDTELRFVGAAVHDAPVAKDDEATLAEDGRIRIDVL